MEDLPQEVLIENSSENVEFLENKAGETAVDLSSRSMNNLYVASHDHGYK